MSSTIATDLIAKKTKTGNEAGTEVGGPVVEIPATCKAGVVIDEGPNFKVAIEDVPVPKPGQYTLHVM